MPVAHIKRGAAVADLSNVVSVQRHALTMRATVLACVPVAPLNLSGPLLMSSRPIERSPESSRRIDRRQARRRCADAGRGVFHGAQTAKGAELVPGALLICLIRRVAARAPIKARL